MIKNATVAVLAVAALALCGARHATADVLLDLVNPPDQNGAPYSLTFTAGAITTDISFAGYQAPERLFAEDISLTSGGGGNLLGGAWTFTPYDPSDTSDAGQFNDGFGSGTNGLFFANGTGRVDRFDQTVTTVVGQTYTLDFLFLNNPDDGSANNGPSELLVSVSPEPESLTLTGLALLGIGFFGRRRLAR